MITVHNWLAGMTTLGRTFKPPSVSDAFRHWVGRIQTFQQEHPEVYEVFQQQRVQTNQMVENPRVLNRYTTFSKPLNSYNVVLDKPIFKRVKNDILKSRKIKETKDKPCILEEKDKREDGMCLKCPETKSNDFVDKENIHTLEMKITSFEKDEVIVINDQSLDAGDGFDREINNIESKYIQENTNSNNGVRDLVGGGDEATKVKSNEFCNFLVEGEQSLFETGAMKTSALVENEKLDSIDSTLQEDEVLSRDEMSCSLQDTSVDTNNTQGNIGVSPPADIAKGLIKSEEIDSEIICYRNPENLPQKLEKENDTDVSFKVEKEMGVEMGDTLYLEEFYDEGNSWQNFVEESNGSEDSNESAVDSDDETTITQNTDESQDLLAGSETETINEQDDTESNSSSNESQVGKEFDAEINTFHENTRESDVEKNTYSVENSEYSDQSTEVSHGLCDDRDMDSNYETYEEKKVEFEIELDFNNKEGIFQVNLFEEKDLQFNFGHIKFKPLCLENFQKAIQKKLQSLLEDTRLAKLFIGKIHLTASHMEETGKDFIRAFENTVPEFALDAKVVQQTWWGTMIARTYELYQVHTSESKEQNKYKESLKEILNPKREMENLKGTRQALKEFLSQEEISNFSENTRSMSELLKQLNQTIRNLELSESTVDPTSSNRRHRLPLEDSAGRLRRNTSGIPVTRYRTKK